jgi:hypothetical protein
MPPFAVILEPLNVITAPDATVGKLLGTLDRSAVVELLASTETVTETDAEPKPWLSVTTKEKL